LRLEYRFARPKDAIRRLKSVDHHNAMKDMKNMQDSVKHILCVTSMAIFVASSTALLPGCDGGAKPESSAGHDHDHDHDHADHDHAEAPKTDGAGGATAQSSESGHGATVSLGEKSVGAYAVRASRDGAVVAGAELPIDVWVTGEAAKVVALRFWVGSEDAKGSMKAKAELEKDNWHTHAESPSPMPANSALWIEFEVEGGEKFVTSFDLKM